MAARILPTATQTASLENDASAVAILSVGKNSVREHDAFRGARTNGFAADDERLRLQGIVDVRGGHATREREGHCIADDAIGSEVPEIGIILSPKARIIKDVLLG